jgi:hypothetical protein
MLKQVVAGKPQTPGINAWRGQIFPFLFHQIAIQEIYDYSHSWEQIE